MLRLIFETSEIRNLLIRFILSMNINVLPELSIFSLIVNPESTAKREQYLRYVTGVRKTDLSFCMFSCEVRYYSCGVVMSASRLFWSTTRYITKK